MSKTISKQIIRCVDHSDKHPSAIVFKRNDGSEWLFCHSCKASRLYKEGTKEMPKSIEEWDEEDYGTDIKQCLNPIELLEMFEEEKGITSEMIEKMGGFITDQGYLGFKYGKGREVYRNLTPHDGRRRFHNEGSNKGLMGDDLIPMWDEIYLVEGLTDYLSFRYEIGTNVVTSFGAELSDEQAYLLRDKTVFILFDRDFSGFKGAKQAEAKLKEWGATPIIIELPDGINLNTFEKKVDVNYLIHKEKDAFKKWLQDRISKYKTFDDNYLEMFKNRMPLKHYDTDIPKIKMTEGLYVISGPPGVGKTTMGVGLTDCFSQQGGNVLYVNYDLPKDQIIARLASRYYKKPSWAEIEAEPLLLNTDEKAEEALKQCLKRIKIMNKLTIDEVKYCKKWYTHMVIDYIQRVPNNNTDRTRGLELIMDDLSDMASNEGMVIVGISRQTLSGNPFSGSASIPYHAQGIMLLTPTDDDIIACQIDKNTRGETGNVLFKVDYPHQRLRPTKLNEIADEKFKDLFGERNDRT